MFIIKKIFTLCKNQKNSYQSQKREGFFLKEKIKKLKLEKNRYFTLQRIIATLVAGLDFEKISQKIVDVMVSDLKYVGGILFLVDEDRKEIYSWTTSQTRIIKMCLELLPRGFREYRSSIKKQEHFISKTANIGKIFINSDFRKFISPTVPSKTAFLIQKIARFKVTISLPIIVKDKVIGVLMFNSRNDEFTKDEIELLKTFTQQAGIAISNARQYEQIQTQVRQLQEKTEDMQSLLDVSEIAASSLKTKNIAQKIVDSVPKKLGHLGYTGSILTMYNRETNHIYTYCITESEIVKKAKKLLSKPFEKHSESIDKASNLVIKTVKTKKMYVGSKLEDFISPTVSKNSCRLIQKLVGAKSFISIPIFSSGRIIGAIVFVGTKPEKEIVQRDKDILFGFSSHIGAAIENVRLYEQTKKQMKSLEELNIDLEKANLDLKELLEVKNNFLHITSHQLRTPLTVIRGMLAMWRAGDFDQLSEKEQKGKRENIYLSAERLNNITNDMLDAMEVEGKFLKFNLEQVSLEDIAKEAMKELTPNYDRKGLYLKLSVKDRLPKIKVEPKYLKQALMNLLDNAEKYTFKGGVKIEIKKENKFILIEIKDTGIGIAKKEQKKLFQKFSRTKRAEKQNTTGSGLGLFIAKQIIEEHQGKIEISSEGVGKGTTVRVWLLRE